MRRICPPLHELQAFDTVARHLNFSRAATELCVTQSAVSRQIASLESFVGMPLFRRLGRRLELTEAGLAYLAKVRAGLDTLETASAELMALRGKGGIINFSVPPTFASQFLIPRLGDFHARHPDISVNFVQYAHSHDFTRAEGFDAAIQIGEGEWPDAVTDYLIGRDVEVVCAPALRRATPLHKPQDLVRVNLLQHTLVPNAWNEWCGQCGVDGLNPFMGPRFEQFSLIVKSAVLGFGVAIVPRCLIEEEIACGQLVTLFGGPFQARQGYYFCVPADRHKLAKVQRFRAWILGVVQGRETPRAASIAARPAAAAQRRHRR